MNTLAKTYRMPAGIHRMITEEAERLTTSEADIVRIALRHYFDDQQQVDAAEATTNRIIARIDAQSERLAQLLGEVLALAK